MWDDKESRNIRENFHFVYKVSGYVTHEQLGAAVELKRWTISRLLSGNQKPNRSHIDRFAKYCGLSRDDFLEDAETFKNVYKEGTASKNAFNPPLKTIISNIGECREVFEKYQGQYIVYQKSSKDDCVQADLLSIDKLTKNGIACSYINPYMTLRNEPELVEYSGYIVPVDEYLYLFAEQKFQLSEVFLMIFHKSPLGNVVSLEGIHNYIGVNLENTKKYIRSSTFIAIKKKQKIQNIKEKIGTALGSLKITSLDEWIQRKIRLQSIDI